MNADITFHCSLADIMADFVAFKRMQGYDYTGKAMSLRSFDHFLLSQGHIDKLLPEHFSAYLVTIGGLSAATRKNHLSTMRQFSTYLNGHRPGSAIVPVGMLPPTSRNVRFYRIEPEQVGELMCAAGKLRPSGSVRASCIRFLIGLLYSTGLRINEALTLNLGDFDREQGVLFVRRGKFGKDRLVVLSSSTAAAMDAWLKCRFPYAATGTTAPLLVGGPNRRLTYWQASAAFKRLSVQCNLQNQPLPRLHDLRHNFACSCIKRWREQGDDIQARLPILANAMGHVDYFSTQCYLHVDAGDLQASSNLLRTHYKLQLEN